MLSDVELIDVEFSAKGIDVSGLVFDRQTSNSSKCTLLTFSRSYIADNIVDLSDHVMEQ